MVPQGRSRLSEGDEVGVFGGLPHHHHAGKGHLAQLALEKGGFVGGNMVILGRQHVLLDGKIVILGDNMVILEDHIMTLRF